MTQKRKNHPAGPPTAQSKRTRYSDGDHGTSEDATSKAPVDPTYGQRSAFPGLDDAGEEDALFYGPANDGLEYLRMVRSEAKGVPNLLTATKSHEEEEEEALYRDYPQGYYEDGAYIAAASLPTAASQNPPIIDADGDTDPQEAYHTSLLTRFKTLSPFLRSPSSSQPNPSASATATVLTNAPTKKWRTTLLYTPPTTALLAQLPQETIINGIAALEKHLEWGMLERGAYVGAWAWGLLARCRSAGMMGSEEVGVLRDLGKKARGLVRGLRAGLGSVVEDVASEDHEVLLGEPVMGNEAEDHAFNHSKSDLAEQAAPNENEEQDMANAKSRLLATLQRSTSSPSSNTPPHPTPGNDARENGIPSTTTRIAATLDMIITVVGEEYGQRDLLDGRMVWGE
ncbi:MAG: hypothetical protein LQ345_001250 [Seirophora villosa]|nr:MAG: hypothetical protein LQ345_001250 [Seirophora villosa]